MSLSGRGSLDALINRRDSSWLERFIAAPLKTLAKSLYQLRKPTPPEILALPVSIVCISDTHNAQTSVPDGDLLIHAGDLTQAGSAQELQATIDWLDSLPHKHKVVIAGNHDRALADDGWKGFTWGTCNYLQDSSIDLRFSGGRVLTFYGSPWTPQHGNWAFQYPKGQDVWTGKIPLGVDVLVTHGPPQCHLDIDGWGDGFLMKELWRTKPALHVFGHVHGGYGKDVIVFDEFESRFENIGRGQGGLLDVLKMSFLLAWSAIQKGIKGTTTLVNPAMIGGLQDRERRVPIVVQI